MVFAWNVLQKSFFMEIVFNKFRDRFLLFLKALEAVFLIFSLENRLENKTFFSDITERESGIWRGDLPVFGPSKDIKA